MNPQEPYVGLDNDQYGGMTDIGRIIRDARAFGIIEPTETCTGWRHQALETLWTKVQEQWGAYGYSVTNLPEDLRDRYLNIQEEAVTKARKMGWDTEMHDDDE